MWHKEGEKKSNKIKKEKLHTATKLALFYYFFLFISHFIVKWSATCIMKFRMFDHTDLWGLYRKRETFSVMNTLSHNSMISLGNVNIFILNIPYSKYNTFRISVEILGFLNVSALLFPINRSFQWCRHFPSSHLFRNVELDCYRESCSSFINDLGMRICTTFIYYIHPQFSYWHRLW